MTEPIPRIGAHTSIAGALENAALEAVGLGLNTFQIFSRSPRMWRATKLDPARIEALKALRKEHALKPLVIHANYLINLAADDAGNRARSTASFRREIKRALAIGAEYVVLHPGSAKDQTPQEAVARLASSFAKATRGIEWSGLELLLENTAGGGATLGRAFSELAAIREAILEKTDAPIGYCLDTAHMFAAGFDISTEAGLEETLRAAGRRLGLRRVRVIHANDSKTALGSRLDRHEHIGKGQIGAEAFRRILRHPKLRRKPFLLETPLGADGTHRANVATLKALAGISDNRQSA